MFDHFFGTGPSPGHPSVLSNGKKRSGMTGENLHDIRSELHYMSEVNLNDVEVILVKSIVKLTVVLKLVVRGKS